MADLRRNKQKAHPKSVAAAEKTQRALELRKAGASYSEIGGMMGFTKKYAFDLVTEGLAELARLSSEDAAAIRNLELARLDSMHMSLWPDRRNPRAAEALLRISERRSKLLGIDAPTKFEGDIGHRHQLDSSELIEKILGAVKPAKEGIS